MLPDANYLSSRCQSQSPRAQNRGFCALLGSETLVSGHFEHKIEVFVLFCLRDPHFRAFRAQNRHFCALWWGHGRGDGRELREQREQREQRGRWLGATGATGATRATRATGTTRTTGATATTGATGTTAGTVWVADILSQGGFV